MRLGRSPSLLENFPDKPKGMHWQTYNRLRRTHDTAEARSNMALMQFMIGRAEA
jgi:hypothetical protein